VSDSSLFALPSNDAFGSLADSIAAAAGKSAGPETAGISATGSPSALLIGLGSGWSLFSIPIYASNNKFYATTTGLGTSA
jgi:hypothetical protein